MKSIVVYPRSYNKRGDSSLHSIQGVDQDGALVNIKLRVHEAVGSEFNPPSVAEFSRTDRKAKHACVASLDNSRESRQGVILFTYCKYEGQKDGVHQWISGWAHVLAEDSDSPDPIYGLARVDVKTKTNETINAQRLYDDMCLRGLQDSPEAQSFLAESNNPANYHFPALIYDFDSAFVSRSFSEISAFIADSIDENTHDGYTGGILIKKHGSSSIADSAEIFARYSVQTRRYQSGQDVATSVDIGSLLESYGSDLVVIPIKRINSGPICNRHYGQSGRYQYINSNFYDGSDAPVIHRCVIKVSFNKETHNTLLSRIYCLDDAGFSLSSYQFEKKGEAQKFPHFLLMPGFFNFMEGDSDLASQANSDFAEIPKDVEFGDGAPTLDERVVLSESPVEKNPAASAMELSPDDATVSSDSVVNHSDEPIDDPSDFSDSSDSSNSGVFTLQEPETLVIAISPFEQQDFPDAFLDSELLFGGESVNPSPEKIDALTSFQQAGSDQALCIEASDFPTLDVLSEPEVVVGPALHKDLCTQIEPVEDEPSSIDLSSVDVAPNPSGPKGFAAFIKART